jgi:hypothetical protein
MTSNAPSQLILLHIICLDNLYSLCQIFICQNSQHPNSTATTQLDHGIILYVCSLWNYTYLHILCFMAIFRQFHELLVTFHCQSCHERHLYSAAMSELFMGLYECFPDVYRKFITVHCSALFKKRLIFELWPCLDRFKPRYLCHFKTLTVQILQTWCWNSC